MAKTRRYDRDWEPGERRASGWSREDGVIEMDIPEPPAPPPTFSIRSRDAATFVLAKGGTLIQAGYVGGFVFVNTDQFAREAFTEYQVGDPFVSAHRYADAAAVIREVLRIGQVVEPIRLEAGGRDGHGRCA